MESRASQIGTGEHRFGVCSHLPPSNIKKLGFAITIIVGIGGLCVGGLCVGGIGLGAYFQVGALSNLSQVHAIIMMAAGGGGFVLVIIGCVGTIKNCQKGVDQQRGMVATPPQRCSNTEKMSLGEAQSLRLSTLSINGDGLRIAPQPLEMPRYVKGRSEAKVKTLEDYAGLTSAQENFLKVINACSSSFEEFLQTPEEVRTSGDRTMTMTLAAIADLFGGIERFRRNYQATVQYLAAIADLMPHLTPEKRKEVVETLAHAGDECHPTWYEAAYKLYGELSRESGDGLWEVEEQLLGYVQDYKEDLFKQKIAEDLPSDPDWHFINLVRREIGGEIGLPPPGADEYATDDRYWAWDSERLWGFFEQAYINNPAGLIEYLQSRIEIASGGQYNQRIYDYLKSCLSDVDDGGEVFYEDDAYTRIKPEFIAVMLLRLQILTP